MLAPPSHLLKEHLQRAPSFLLPVEALASPASQCWSFFFSWFLLLLPSAPALRESRGGRQLCSTELIPELRALIVRARFWPAKVQRASSKQAEALQV